MKISDYFCMVKVRRSVSINKDILVWIQSQIEKKRFKDVSHAFEFAIYRLKIIDERCAS